MGDDEGAAENGGYWGEWRVVETAVNSNNSSTKQFNNAKIPDNKGQFVLLTGQFALMPGFGLGDN